MLWQNIHRKLDPPTRCTSLVIGDYSYYHYGCDGVDDRGWGCGYRTLQSMCSWILGQRGEDMNSVPSLRQFQDALVKMGDKDKTFSGSKSWIGSFEICLCIDYFYQAPCKLVHVPSGRLLSQHLPDLNQHFLDMGSVVMMGGDTDNASKGILGVSMEQQSLLVMDPHQYGDISSVEDLQQNGMLSWRPVDSFHEDSFYNFCLPQLKAKR